MLIKELQSLCLDIKVLNINNEEIDLKQKFDDDDDLIPTPAIDDEIDYSTEDDDFADGFAAEDEDGLSSLDDDDFDDDYDDDDDFGEGEEE